MTMEALVAFAKEKNLFAALLWGGG